ncbi:M23 family metallopeptidase [Novosphingobium sp. Leaf2]|uniref:M23 family metallopeptidase n=1 Tax=Novosphingobium sp. Leaf2 TaxID=1735670 RepID=UPI00070198C2|nr:M23 family metallopeptidase [Novosphingobium sp. Leaf2]KQM19658.1 hypothetical protein ASE49_05475 [Novosphingobium sp. Leaf2]
MLPPVVHQAQVEIRALNTPRPTRGSDGALHVAYELRITSFQAGSDLLRLTKLQVWQGSDPRPLMTLEGRALAGVIVQTGDDGDATDGVPIAAGTTRTLFLWLRLAAPRDATALRHELTFTTAHGVVQIARNVRIPVSAVKPIVIAPPLRAGPWLAAEGPGNHLSHHWGGITAIDGKLTIPQRFAIDWFLIDDRGHAFSEARPMPSATTDEDWFGYNQDVLAVADGVVVDARDGVPNGKPLAPVASPDDLTSRTLYGNFVVLKIGPNVYAHYAHLRNGSVTMRIGQRVKRGTVIGRLGQTGAAGAPHLHFHLSDSARFEQSEGLSYVIDSFARIGHGSINDMLDPARPVDWRSKKTDTVSLGLPLDGDIVRFAG